MGYPIVKAYLHVALVLLVTAGSTTVSSAAETARPSEPANESVPDTEPVKCYRIAWESQGKGGLGLNAGQAVRLCSGATNALKVVLCYVQAWEHPNNGGLGLTAGQAIALCKTSADSAAQ
jgi:hypothetical protein